jgi:hypothetical protein
MNTVKSMQGSLRSPNTSKFQTRDPNTSKFQSHKRQMSQDDVAAKFQSHRRKMSQDSVPGQVPRAVQLSKVPVVLTVHRKTSLVGSMDSAWTQSLAPTAVSLPDPSSDGSGNAPQASPTYSGWTQSLAPTTGSSPVPTASPRVGDALPYAVSHSNITKGMHTTNACIHTYTHTHAHTCTHTHTHAHARTRA